MTDDRDDESIIRQLEHERFAAIVDGDWDLFASHCHPDLTYVHTDAVVDTRDSYLAHAARVTTTTAALSTRSATSACWTTSARVR
jgi:hypothetical protein